MLNWGRMFKVVSIQLMAVLLAVLGAWFFVGIRGGLSAALGGLVCVLPNFLFALYLKATAKKGRLFYLAGFMLGELFKLALTFVLLLLAAKLFVDLHWPSLLIGLVLALQAVFLAFWIKN